MFRFRTAAFMCFVFLFSAIGCGGPPPSAKLSGKFTYKGQVVKGGTVLFKFENGQAASAISSDGLYAFTDLPLGLAKVTIETETYNPAAEHPVYAKAAGQADDRLKSANQYAEAMGKGGPAEKGAGNTSTGLGGPFAAELAKLYVKIPVKYTNEKTSGLSYTVVQGTQTKDFELTD